MKLEFDNFSHLNKRRCEVSFKRKVCPASALVHVLGACGEVGEMAQDMKRIMDLNPELTGTPFEEERIKRMLFEAADAFTYLDLVASHYGYKFSDILVEKFNIVSDRIGSLVKIPV